MNFELINLIRNHIQRPATNGQTTGYNVGRLYFERHCGMLQTYWRIEAANWWNDSGLRAGNSQKIRKLPMVKHIFCIQLDMVIARCVIPVNAIFKTGIVIIRLSVDGGKNYPWWNRFYISKLIICTTDIFSGQTMTSSYALIGSTPSEFDQWPSQPQQQLEKFQAGQFDNDLAQLQHFCLSKHASRYHFVGLLGRHVRTQFWRSILYRHCLRQVYFLKSFTDWLDRPKYPKQRCLFF